MSSPQLTPVSYVVLGMVAEGATTSYDMKQKASRSVGYFWNFPHSQLYAEPGPLVERGLPDEEREAEGRRRRVYTLTAAGREALDDWLREPTSEQPQIRDAGLLKLFFGEGLRRDERAARSTRRSPRPSPTRTTPPWCAQGSCTSRRSPSSGARSPLLHRDGLGQV